MKQLSLHDWSIRLGFCGDTTSKAFTSKLESVKKVRKGIINDIIISLIAFISFDIIWIYTNSYNNDFSNVLTLPLTFMTILCLFSAIVHIRIVYQWKRIEKQNILEYKEWQNEK